MRSSLSWTNPHCLWLSSGMKWICNLCQLTNDCPQWYRKNLDGQYQRRDRKLNNQASDDAKIPAQIKNLRNKFAAIQCAMLYLTVFGKVYIRVLCCLCPSCAGSRMCFAVWIWTQYRLWAVLWLWVRRGSLWSMRAWIYCLCIAGIARRIMYVFHHTDSIHTIYNTETNTFQSQQNIFGNVK